MQKETQVPANFLLAPIPSGTTSDLKLSRYMKYLHKIHSSCMQDSFARARTRPILKAEQPLGQARDDRVYCIQTFEDHLK